MSVWQVDNCTEGLNTNTWLRQHGLDQLITIFEEAQITINQLIVTSESEIKLHFISEHCM